MLDSLTSTVVHSVQPGRAVLQQPPPPPPHLPLTSPSRAPSLHSTLAIFFFPALHRSFSLSRLSSSSSSSFFFLPPFFFPVLVPHHHHHHHHSLFFFLSPCSLLSPLPPYFLTAPLYFLSLPTPTCVVYLAVISQRSGESCLFSIFFSFFMSGSLHGRDWHIRIQADRVWTGNLQQ